MSGGIVAADIADDRLGVVGGSSVATFVSQVCPATNTLELLFDGILPPMRDELFDKDPLLLFVSGIIQSGRIVNAIRFAVARWGRGTVTRRIVVDPFVVAAIVFRGNTD